MEFLLLTLIIAVGILFYLFKDKIYIFFKAEEEHLPFKRKEFLMNIPERKFFEELQNIISDNHVVFPQVLLSSIVKVISSRKDFWKYYNKINRKTIDYVIFEKPYFMPVLAIEYDGRTHDRDDRQERDDFVDNVLNSAGIKSFHIKHQKNINFEEVKNKAVEMAKAGKSLKSIQSELGPNPKATMRYLKKIGIDYKDLKEDLIKSGLLKQRFKKQGKQKSNGSQKTAQKIVSKVE